MPDQDRQPRTKDELRVTIERWWTELQRFLDGLSTAQVTEPRDSESELQRPYTHFLPDKPDDDGAYQSDTASPATPPTTSISTGAGS